VAHQRGEATDRPELRQEEPQAHQMHPSHRCGYGLPLRRLMNGGQVWKQWREMNGQEVVR
jgi:hypothetical protein